MPDDLSGPNHFARDLFAPLPARYDRLAELLSFGQNGQWRTAMVGRVVPADGVILDVASGTAGVALQLAARSRARVVGVDLTEPMLRQGQRRVAAAGQRDRITLVAGRGERLPFADASFDVVYSWGVMHHSERPEVIVREIRRVLKPGGTFIGMMYSRRSLVAWKLWVRRALLSGKPWRSLADVLWHHVESLGTKGYTQDELRSMFASFVRVEISPVATVYDRKWLGPLARLVPDALGWNLAIRAVMR